MTLFISLVFGGIIWGSAYALVALGVTIVYGMMRVINFSHGDFFMLTAYFMWTFVTLLGMNFFLGAVLALAAALLFGALVERFLIRSLVDAPIINSALLTMGISAVMQNAVILLWDPQQKNIATPFNPNSYQWGPIAITQNQMFILITTAAAIIGFNLILKRTRLGKAIRATFQDRDVAALNGINTKWIYSLTFNLGISMACIGGILLGPTFTVYPTMGAAATLKSMGIVVMGGLGNFTGAIIGGLLLGIVESLAIGYISSGFSNAICFAAVILVLSIKPYGILGEKRL